MVPFDFHLTNSKDEEQAISLCRSALRSNSRADGERLWRELLRRAGETRVGTGTLDTAVLWWDLRRDFDLKDHPDFDADWSLLHALTTDCRARIEKGLPGGNVLPKQTERDALEAALRKELVVIVHGDSGVGKSALVRDALDGSFQGARQVWVDPAGVESLVREVSRRQAGFRHAPVAALKASARAENILVLDAAERIAEVGACAALIDALLTSDAGDVGPFWRVVIVGQTVAWESGELSKIAGTRKVARHEVKPLTFEEARQALASQRELAWLASQSEALTALTNPRTLAWVIEAAARFREDGRELSLTTIADTLWRHWTSEKVAAQQLLMHLGERDATFEHSFPVSTFDKPEVPRFACGLPAADHRQSRPLRP